MFWVRLGPLIESQMLEAVATASSYDSEAKRLKNEFGSLNAVSRSARNRSTYHCLMTCSCAST